MAYTNSISLALGSSKAGLSLRAQLFDTAGANVGSAVSSGFVEIGQGNYIWTYSSFPDAFRGGVKFYDVAVPAIVLAATAINPEEIETVKNIEEKVNSIESVIDELTNPPKEVTIEIPHILTQGSTVEIIAGTSTPSSSIQIITGEGS
jgi:hypothetical protein